jgi:hypothetical protein
MCALEGPGGKSPFERRRDEALARQQSAPATESVIHLQDLSTTGQEGAQAVPDGNRNEAQDAQRGPTPRYFMLMPNERAEAPRGGQYIVDDSADIATVQGAFEYNGHRLRPVNEAEGAELIAITANATRRQTEGARRLNTLNPMPRTPNVAAPAPAAGGGPGGNGNDQPPAGPPPGPTPGPRPTPPPGPLNAPATLDAAPPPPRWQGKYFANVENGGSWHDFDVARYGSIIPKPLSEIRDNPTYNQRYGELIMATDPSKIGLFEKVLAGQPLSAEENGFIQFTQYEFTKVALQMEKIDKVFNKNTVEMLMAVNDEFRQMVDKHGAEQSAIDAFKNGIFHAGVTDKGAFEQMSKGFERWGDLKETTRVKNAEAAVQKICEEMKIPRRNFETMFADPNKTSEEIREQVVTHLTNQALRGRKALNFAHQLGINMKAGRLIQQATFEMPTEWHLISPRSWKTSALMGARTDIASVLGDVSLSAPVADADFRQKMELSAITGAPLGPLSYEQGPKTFGEVRSLSQNNAYSEATLQNTIREQINRTYGSVENFSQRPQWEQDTALRDISAQAGGENARGFGLMALLWRILFGNNFKKAATNVLNRPVNIR